MIDEENKNNYQIIRDKDRLFFTTSSFRAEKSSVLHSGVYSREFSSMLFASAVCMLAYMFMLSVIYLALIRYIVLVAIFIAAFLCANIFIFKKKHLEAVFDRSSRIVRITRPGIITKDVEEIPFAGIGSVELGSKRFTPENIDGINFVRKISLQHGSDIPGLGEEEEFITLSLKLTDSSERIIYAGKTDEEPAMPVNEIKNFILNKED